MSRAVMSLGGMSLAAAVLTGCTSPPLRAALSGDLPSLKAAVQQAERDGKLGESGARDIAGAVLSRELVSLKGPDERFPDVASCTRQVRSALADVARGEGEFAGSAALALLEGGVNPPAPNSPAVKSVVLAREGEGPARGASRRAFMLHGDSEVRRAAMLAARAMADPRDITALLEAARLDPDLGARRLAVRALGAIGGETVVLGLSDVWQTASADVRTEILLAWGEPPSLAAGGAAQLVTAAEAGKGELVVAAAIELERRGAGPPGLATRILLEALKGGDSAARRRALRDAPWSNPELRAAIAVQAHSDDPSTQLLAALRLALHAALDAESTARLLQLSQEGATIKATIARAVLARAGNESARDGLRGDLAAPKANQRLLAALGLVSLGDWAGAAHALGDDSPEVRRAVACQLLSGSFTDEATQAGAPLRAFGPMAPELLAMLDDSDRSAKSRPSAAPPPNKPKAAPKVERKARP